MLFDRLASRVFGADTSLHQPARPRRQHARPAEPVGPRHLGRPADRARCASPSRRRCRSCGSCCSAGVLARQRAARRRRDPERAPGGLPRRDAAAADAARAGAAVGRLARQAGRHVPAARRRDGARPIATCCPPSPRVVLRGDLGDLAAQLERPAPWLYDEHDVPRAARAAAAGAGADAGRRSRRWSWRTASAASRRTAANTSSCSTATARRRCRGRTCWPIPSSARSSSSVGLGVHLGGQQPREPADAVRQRSGDRSDRRGDLPARRGHGRGVGRDAGAAAAPRRRRPLGRPPRRGRHALPARRSPGIEQELAVFVAPRRSREAVAC